MCEPTTIAIASLALAAGGTAYGVTENQAAVRRANSNDRNQAAQSAVARTAEMARQDKMSKSAWDNWQAQLAANGAKPMTEAVATHADQATATTGQAQAQGGLAMGLLPGGEGAAPELQDDVAKRTAVASQRARQRIAAMSQLAGYTGAGQAAGVRDQQFADNLRLDNSMRASSLGVSRLEGSTVPMSTGSPSALAGGLVSLGQLGTQYAGGQGAFNGLWPAAQPIPKSTVAMASTGRAAGPV